MIGQARVTRIYERNAPVYDLMEAPLEWLGARRWRVRLCRGLEGHVLEVGAGTGKNLAHYDEGALLVALDPSARMLERARRRARRLSRSVELIAGEAQAMPFPDGSFDAVTGSFVFCSVAEPLAGLREVRRVLKPGGVLRLLEHQRPPQPFLAGVTDALDPLAVRLTGAHFNRPTDANVRLAGFADVESVRLDPLGVFRLITARKQS